MEKWKVKVELKTREVIEKEFPYNADGDERKEQEEWKDILRWIFVKSYKPREVLYYDIRYINE